MLRLGSALPLNRSFEFCPHSGNLLVQCSPFPHVHFGSKLLALTFPLGFGYRAVKFPAHTSIIRTSKSRRHKIRIVRDNYSMTIGKGKRPCDPNQLAKWIVDASTSEASGTSPSSAALPSPPAPASISAYMAAMGRKGGQIGGKRRLLTMTPAARKAAAAKAAKARWGTRKER